MVEVQIKPVESILKVFLPSITHTGTNLMRYIILREQYQACDRDFLFGADSGKSLHCFHVDERGISNALSRDWIKAVQSGEHLVFSPMRHPQRVAQSFKQRYREGFDEQWNYFAEHIHPYVTAYVHVDVKAIRDRQVQVIAKLIDEELSCDWPISAKSGCWGGTHDMNPDNCPAVKEKYIDFYYGTIDESKD